VIIHSVSDATRFIKGILEHEYGLRGILIRGEISNFKKYPGSGHCYFTLKDNEAALKCVMFKSWARFLRFQLQNGMQVIASGDISIYERDGVYQLYVNNMQPDGVGSLALAYEQLKNKLEGEGLFAQDRKQELPFMPKKIGIVTSASGAVLHDIYTVAKHRSPGTQLILYPVAVQGDGAAAQIAKGIAYFNKKNKVDVLIVGRGGGSAEDLWAFNEEKTVRAIASSAIPVISAVGHETDFSLSDFAADIRAATPSHAAELAVPDVTILQKQVRNLRIRLERALKRQFSNKRQQLGNYTRGLLQLTPNSVLSSRRQHLDELMQRLNTIRANNIACKKVQIEERLNRLELLNPLRILKCGYSIVAKDKAIVKSVVQLKEGDLVNLTLADGSANVVVNNIKRGDNNG